MLSEKKVILEVVDGWEAKALKKRYASPQCYLTKGMIEGFLKEVTGEEWDVEEKECIAMGFKSCKFLVKKKTR